MNSNKNKPNQLFRLLPYLLFFILITFFLYKFTNYLFFYQEKSSLFLVSFAYLVEHFNQPGGFLKYLGELQSAFYFYPLVGAVLVSLEIVVIIFLISKTAKTMAGRNYYFLPFLLGAALFYLQTNYQFVSLNNLGILIQVFLFFVVVRKCNGRFLWLPVVLFPFQYLLFGSFSFIFLISFSLFLVLNEKKKGISKLISIWILGMVFFFVGMEFLFFQTSKTLLQFPYSALNTGFQSKLFISIFILISILPLFYKFKTNRFTAFSVRKISWIEFMPYFVMVAIIFLIVPRIDKKNSDYFHVEKLFYEQKYNELIAFNIRFPSSNKLTAFLNNIALAETGKLSDSFFSFPQMPDGSTLYLKWEIISEVLKRGGYYYYSLGMINEAQRWAYEYMVMRGNSPEALKMMIKTDLIKGKYKTAEKYISLLEKSIFYRKDALEFRQLLYNENAINSHPELGNKRKLDTKQDFFVQTENPGANLDFILEADSTNTIALEYKLAFLMLQKNMQGIVDLLPAMESVGYSKIPKNVEEAIVTFKLLKVGEMPALGTLRINPETEQRFNRYYQIFQQNQGSRQQAQRALAQDFSNTYWYYVFFD